MAASVGMDRLQVVRKPRVALFSTGDELVMPGAVAPADMREGAIYNSNRFFLRAMLLRLGCDVSDLGIVPDQRAATVRALQDASQDHDLILTSGGVSVGEEDHIRPAVESLGELDLWQIAIKPGKPFRLRSCCQSAFHRIAGQSGVEFCHLCVAGAPVSAATAGRARRGARSWWVRAPISTGRAPIADASFCVCDATPTVDWTCSPTRVPAC